MVKKGSDEVDEASVTAEEWPKWRISGREEWNKVLNTGSVKPLSPSKWRTIEGGQ